MRTKLTLLASIIGASLLTACGGGDMLSRSDSETHKLIPEVVTEDPTAARPSENAPVLRTSETKIMWTDGVHQVLPIGVELDYGADSTTRFDAISEAAKVSAGAIRLVVTPETPAANLEAALNRAAAEGLFVNLTLNDPALYCRDSGEDLLRITKSSWFGTLRPIIAQDKFQPMMMISLARGWGPKEVFDPTSTGYREYMDYTKTLIRDFRKAGFKFPLVVEAPGCGEDFNAFDANRVRELLAADTEKNLIFGLATKGRTYNTSAKIANAVNVIRSQRAPVIFTEVGGSDVVEKGAKAEQVINGAFVDVAVSVNPQWQGPGDKVAYLFPFAATQNLKNTQLSFDINFDDAYLDAEYLTVEGAASMGYQLYLRDVNDNYANIQWNEVKAASSGWNNFTYKIGANMPTTGWVSEGFDMTQVVAVGMELAAQDKPASVAGPIKMDNFKLVEGTGPAVVYASDFSAGPDGWANSQWEGKTATISTADGETTKAISLIPQDDQFEITRAGLTVDLTQSFTMTARIYIPSSITAFGMGVFAANSTNWAGGGWAGTWNLIPGQWNDYSFTPDEATLAQFAASGGSGLGIQFSQFTADQIKGDAILIENLQIVSAAGAGATETEFGVQYRSDFTTSTDGWGNTGWPDDNQIPSSPVLTPSADGLIAASSKDGVERISLQKNNLNSLDSLNLGEGFKVTVNVFIPESLRDTEFNFQMFFQDSNWSHHNSPIDMTGEDLKYGEWMTISVEPAFPPGFDLVGTPKFVGIDMFARKGAGGFKTTDEVIIGSILFEGQIPVEPEEVVLGAVDFNRSQNVLVDFVDGAITEEQATVIASDVISDPLGWFASTWFAADPENAGYDLVTDLANAETLTERGELIVNTPGGLAEMRSYLVPETETPETTPVAQ
ncbi:hypothetical protein [Cellvibrio sp. NN19]|uniref:hypothetical protein n=1 Tax=Cellvibrio chitinivorans TaxID=3102792 RepID=UPI002B411B6F|nr:hypothetical protein [Cellvibrio sp. NN19]